MVANQATNFCLFVLLSLQRFCTVDLSLINAVRKVIAVHLSLGMAAGHPHQDLKDKIKVLNNHIQYSRREPILLAVY